jgi:hypothetical protein
MIDTDKYEGHTPAPWRFGKQEPPLYLRLAIQAGKAKSEDLQLMADAPLLLEEVKRLREELVTYADFVFWVDIEHNISFDEYERRVGLK